MYNYSFRIVYLRSHMHNTAFCKQTKLTALFSTNRAWCWETRVSSCCAREATASFRSRTRPLTFCLAATWLDTGETNGYHSCCNTHTQNSFTITRACEQPLTDYAAPLVQHRLNVLLYSSILLRLQWTSRR